MPQQPQEPPGAILIVDDSATARSLMEKAVQVFSTIEVVKAATAEEGLAVLRGRDDIHLLMLDHQLDSMTGLDFLVRMAELPHCRDIPVLVVTALEHDDTLVSAYLDAGAAEFMPKRYRPPIFRARVSALLRQHADLRRRRAAEKSLAVEHRRQQDLLRNTLPERVVREVMATGSFRPSVVSHAGILFADVCGFTRYTREHTPAKVVVGLNRLVRRFEGISDAMGLEKIKTIGDAYMAAIGVLEPMDGIEERMLDAALEMIRQTAELDIGWEIKVGLAFGPTVAGIIGTRRMQFDVWGGTVNLAARMCASAQPSQICLPAESWRALGRSGATLRKVVLKGVGECEVAFLDAAAHGMDGAIITKIERSKENVRLD